MQVIGGGPYPSPLPMPRLPMSFNREPTAQAGFLSGIAQLLLSGIQGLGSQTATFPLPPQGPGPYPAPIPHTDPRRPYGSVTRPLSDALAFYEQRYPMNRAPGGR